jgi:hypothetical protein
MCPALEASSSLQASEKEVEYSPSTTLALREAARE